MTERAESSLPLARKDGLVVQELTDEVLVYDLERDKAHCLNHAAALVWKQCDGRTTALEMAGKLGRDLQASMDEQLIWLALRQLEEVHLLEDHIAIPARMNGITRRQMSSRLGVAAVLAVPLVLSISAPTRAQFVSGPTGQTGATGPTGATGVTGATGASLPPAQNFA